MGRLHLWEAELSRERCLCQPSQGMCELNEPTANIDPKTALAEGQAVLQDLKQQREAALPTPELWGSQLSSEESDPRGVQAPYTSCSRCFPSCAIVSAHLGTSREALSLCQVLRAGVLDQGRDRSAASSRCLSSCSSTCPGHARAAPTPGNPSLPWGYQVKETQMLQPHPRQPRAVPSIIGR